MDLYKNYKKYGPYEFYAKGVKRLLLALVHKETGKKTSVSYPKYLMEQSLGRRLVGEECIHHIDGNPLNNELGNLKVINRVEHSKLHANKKPDVKLTCIFCGDTFIIRGTDLRNRNRKKTGPYCSRSCSGKYGKSIQMLNNNIER